MALTKEQRDALPDSAFALPATRQYPIPDQKHARLALGEARANATPAEQLQVRAAVATRYPGLLGKVVAHGKILNRKAKD